MLRYLIINKTAYVYEQVKLFSIYLWYISVYCQQKTSFKIVDFLFCDFNTWWMYFMQIMSEMLNLCVFHYIILQKKYLMFGLPLCTTTNDNWLWYLLLMEDAGFLQFSILNIVTKNVIHLCVWFNGDLMSFSLCILCM